MPRKVTYTTTDTLSAFQTKVNQNADYVGDLDDLSTRIKFGAVPYYDPATGLFDSAQGGFSHQSPGALSLANVLNLIDSGSDKVFGRLTDSLGLGLVVHFISADSAVFNLVGTGNLNTDSAFILIDSATVNGLLTGLSLDFDSAQIDSARIDYLSGSFINYDSGFGLGLGESAWPGQGTFDIIRLDSATADSGVMFNLSGTSLNYDSAVLTKVSIDSAHLPNNTNMDIVVLDSSTIGQMNFARTAITDMKKLLITNNDSGSPTVVLGGFLVSTNNDSAIP
jgi:hypothetical protein